MLHRPLAITLLALGGALATALSAHAGLELRIDNATSVTGELDPATEVETLVAEVPAGARLSITAKGLKSDGAAAPAVTFRIVDEDAVDVAVGAVRGRRAKLRGFTTETSGRYRILVTGDGVVGGRYKLDAKWKAPRGVKQTVELGRGDTEVRFAASPGSLATISVKAAKGSGALPRLIELRAPDTGLVTEIEPVSDATSRKHKVKKLPVPAGGDLVLVLRDAGVEGGAAIVTVKLKAPKTAKRKIDISDVVLPGSGGDSPLRAGANVFGRVVDAAGGLLQIDDPAFGPIFGALLSVPPGAVTTPATLLMAEAVDVVVTTAAFDVVGPAVFFGPAGTQFSVPVTVTIPYDPAVLLGSTSRIRVFEREADGTVTLIDPENYTFSLTGSPPTSTVSFPVSSFTSFQAFAVPAVPPSETKLVAADTRTTDQFGSPVAIDGNTALIGASLDDDGGSASGSAYVFTRDGAGAWTEQAKLTASDAAGGDRFATSVSIDGDTAVVGANAHTDSTDAGSAYVFTRDGAGVWTEQAELGASDGLSRDRFGTSVAVSGDTIFVGAPSADDAGPSSGSVYVFTRDGAGVWTEKVKLVASDPVAGGNFGDAVALDTDTAAIGARSGSTDTLGAGTAYVFVRDGVGDWAEQTQLVASDLQEEDAFGFSVAIDGDTIVVGAVENDVAEPDGGSAFVFTRDGAGVWTEQSQLVGSDTVDGDDFGDSVAIDGDIALVGAPRNSAAGLRSGAVYVFARDASGIWSQRLQLTASDTTGGGAFGGGLAFSGDTAVVGARQDDEVGRLSGAIYIYDLEP